MTLCAEALRPTVIPHMGLAVPLSEIYDWLEREGYATRTPPHAAPHAAGAGRGAAWKGGGAGRASSSSWDVAVESIEQDYIYVNNTFPLDSPRFPCKTQIHSGIMDFWGVAV